MHLIVFDVDGTLVDSKEFDDRLYELAVQRCWGLKSIMTFPGIKT